MFGMVSGVTLSTKSLLLESPHGSSRLIIGKSIRALQTQLLLSYTQGTGGECPPNPPSPFPNSLRREGGDDNVCVLLESCLPVRSLPRFFAALRMTGNGLG